MELHYVPERDMDNSMTPRVTAAIAVGQVHNGTGTGIFFSLTTNHTIKANHSTPMPFSSDAIKHINALALRDHRSPPNDPVFTFHGATLKDADDPTDSEDPPVHHTDPGPQPSQPLLLPDLTKENLLCDPYVERPPQLSPEDLPTGLQPSAFAPLEAEHGFGKSSDTHVRGVSGTSDISDIEVGTETYEDLPGLVDSDDNSDDEDERKPLRPLRSSRASKTSPASTTAPTTCSRPVADQDNAESTNAPNNTSRYPTRERKAPDRLNLTDISEKVASLCIIHITAKRAMKENPVETAPAILTELQNLTKKKVFTGRHLHELSDFQRKRILRSQMNITRKVAPNSDGTGRAADKVKARLVAGNDGQDRNMYSRSETSSPTATTSGLAIVLMLAAERGCHCVTADVGCAYLNAAMPKGDTEILVFIKIAADIASTLIEVDPSMEAYVRADGQDSNRRTESSPLWMC